MVFPIDALENATKRKTSKKRCRARNGMYGAYQISSGIQFVPALYFYAAYCRDRLRSRPARLTQMKDNTGTSTHWASGASPVPKIGRIGIVDA